jgi:hypothetical protein
MAAAKLIYANHSRRILPNGIASFPFLRVPFEICFRSRLVSIVEDSYQNGN